MRTIARFVQFTLIALTAALMLAVMSPVWASAGDCDGDGGNNTVTCVANPSVPDNDVGLGLGDDVYVQVNPVGADRVAGDSQEDGTSGFGAGGNDTLTIGGNANRVVGDGVAFNGGNDTIVIEGSVTNVFGDDADNGGHDTITVNGSAGTVYGDDASTDGGSDTITINGSADTVAGDSAFNNGGNDTIVINGSVTSDVVGDRSGSQGGNDTITINGQVGGDVLGDSAVGDGDDTVIIGSNGQVAGVIDGQGGTDELRFHAATQAELSALSPAGGTAVFNGHTYTWLNFEALIGLLQELAESGALRMLLSNDYVLAFEPADQLGITILAEHGRIAYISYASLSNLSVGEMQVHTTPNAAGWYATVTNYGSDGTHPGNQLYRVGIYNAGGVLVGEFEFWN